MSIQKKKRFKVTAIILVMSFMMVTSSCEFNEQNDFVEDISSETEDRGLINRESGEVEIIIPDEELALEIGKLIIIRTYPFVEEYNQPFEVVDEDEYWCVYSYRPDPTNEDGERIGTAFGGGATVTFRKSDCKIVDLDITR